MHPLSDIPDVSEENMVSLLREMGIAPVPGYSFYAGDIDGSDITLLTESSDTESFRLMSVAADEGGSEDAYLSLVGRVFSEIRANQPDAVEFVDPGKNLYPDLWKKIAKKPVFSREEKPDSMSDSFKRVQQVSAHIVRMMRRDTDSASSKTHKNKEAEKMKKTISVLLAAVLGFGCLFTLSGCGREKPVEPETGSGAVAGGWGGEIVGSEIPENAKKVFDSAVDGILEASCTPVAYLGSQVVAGTKHSYLCKITAPGEEPETRLCKIIIYKDLEGNATVTDTIDVDLLDYVGGSSTEIRLPTVSPSGGWRPGNTAAAALPENAQAAFDKAIENTDGIEYKPLALLGSQVVAGVNYAILVSASDAAGGPASALAVMIVYADLEGGATVTSVEIFPVR